MPLWGFLIHQQRLFAGWIFSTRPNRLFSAGRGFPVQYGEINIPQTQSPERAKYISIGCKPYEIKISTTRKP